MKKSYAVITGASSGIGMGQPLALQELYKKEIKETLQHRLVHDPRFMEIPVCFDTCHVKDFGNAMALCRGGDKKDDSSI